MRTILRWGRSHEPTHTRALAFHSCACVQHIGEHRLRRDAPEHTARDGALWNEMFYMVHRRAVLRWLGDVPFALARNQIIFLQLFPHIGIKDPAHVEPHHLVKLHCILVGFRHGQSEAREAATRQFLRALLDQHLA